MIRWFADIVKGFWTVLVGMRITLRHLFTKPVTMHYPEQKWPMPERFRGMIECDIAACIVCDQCVKACPVDCITIGWKREEGKSGKLCTVFTVDYQKCMYCGLCVSPCPTDAIYHSHHYENSAYTREECVIDWAQPEHLVTNPKAKPVKTAAKPAAS